MHLCDTLQGLLQSVLAFASDHPQGLHFSLIHSFLFIPLIPVCCTLCTCVSCRLVVGSCSGRGWLGHCAERLDDAGIQRVLVCGRHAASHAAPGQSARRHSLSNTYQLSHSSTTAPTAATTPSPLDHLFIC